MLGEVELDELLSHRDKLNLRIQSIIDQRTESAGLPSMDIRAQALELLIQAVLNILRLSHQKELWNSG